MSIIFQKTISREDLIANPDCRYCFGDNDAGMGTGGQAAFGRGFPNTIGIRTKKSPFEYWTDMEFTENVIKIQDDLLKITLRLNQEAVYEDLFIYWCPRVPEWCLTK